MPTLPAHEWVKEVREDRKIRQEDVEKETGAISPHAKISQSHLSKIERGRKSLISLGAERMDALRRVLGLSPEEWLEGTGIRIITDTSPAVPKIVTHRVLAFVPITPELITETYESVLAIERLPTGIEPTVEPCSDGSYVISAQIGETSLTINFEYISDEAFARKSTLHAAAARYPDFPEEEEEIDEALQEAGQIFGNMPEFAGIADQVTQRALQGIDFKHRPQTPQEWLARFLKYRDDLPSSGGEIDA